MQKSSNLSRTPRQDPVKSGGMAPVPVESPPRFTTTRGGRNPTMKDLMGAIVSLESKMENMEGRILARVSDDMRVLATEVESRVVAQCQSHTADAIRTYHNDVTAKLQSKLDRLTAGQEAEEAKLTAVLHGVPECMDRKSVDSMLRRIDNTFNSLRMFTNPTTKKTTAILSFGSMSSRNEYVTKFRAEDRFLNDGDMKHHVTLVSGKTKLQRERNAAIRSKLDELKASANHDQKWDIDWMKRVISLNGKVVYKQQKFPTEIVEIRKRSQ